MCGIAGWFDPTHRIAADTDRMARLLRHRGPDSSAVETLHGATLIHTRLEIVGRGLAGAQPAWSSDRAVCVVFNGEIYNHRQLRRELASRGRSADGGSDTAVIAPLYLEYGDDFVNKLQGMFAIALVDTRRRRMLLARDRFGIKPLFWGECGAGVAFASELQALRTIPGIDLTVDAQAVHDFLALHHIPPPMTIHRGIRSLEPGHLITVEAQRDGVEVRRRAYHCWSFAERLDADVDDVLESLGEKLDAAVRSQLESEVPLGALLSGGIDSSLICHAAQRTLNSPLQTFGVSFADPSFDERNRFEAVAAYLRTEHRTLSFGTKPPSWEHIVSVLLATGQPFADTSIFGVDAIAALVRSEVTVALSGDGGDEVHAGYDMFGRVEQLARLLAMPRPLRALVSAGAGAMGTMVSRTSAVRVAARLTDVAAATSPAHVVADQLSWIRPGEQRRLWLGPEALPTARLFEPQWVHSSGRGLSDRLHDLLTEGAVRVRLAGDYLPKIDVASMRHSLEVRVPFLDEDLFAFGLSLPRTLTRPSPKSGKILLRKLAEHRVPPIAGLPKWGFGVPFDSWVARSHGPSVRALLAKGALVHEWIDPQATTVLIDDFVAGTVPPSMTRQGAYQRVVMLMALELHLQGFRA